MDPKRWKDTEGEPVGDLIRRSGPVGPMPPALRDALRAGIEAPPPPTPKLGAKAAVPAAIGGGAIAAIALVIALRGGSATVTPAAVDATLVTSPTAVLGAPLPSPSAGNSLGASPSGILEGPSTAATSASARPNGPSQTPAHATASTASARVSADPAGDPRDRRSGPAGDPRDGRVDTLAQETALIARARGELTTNPAATIAAVDEHAQRFPRGELAPERDYLRVSALRRLGRIDEARVHGRKYLRAYPSSPYAPTVREMLEGEAHP